MLEGFEQTVTLECVSEPLQSSLCVAGDFGFESNGIIRKASDSQPHKIRMLKNVEIGAEVARAAQKGLGVSEMREEEHGGDVGGTYSVQLTGILILIEWGFEL